MYVMDLLILLLLALPTPALAVLREFHFVNLLKNWTEAQSYCRDNFDDLATLESAEDWARVTEIVGTWDAWIGMYDDVNSWRWSLDSKYLHERELGRWFNFVVNNEQSKQHCVDMINPQLNNHYCNTAKSSVCYDETSNSYISVTDPKTWQEAQSYCRQTYTDLASIRNQQEWDNVMDAITTAGRHWIGLSRESWKWSDQSNSSFRQWAAGQPHGGDEQCGGAFVDGLFDYFCHMKRPFICSDVSDLSAVADLREFHFVNQLKNWTEAQSYCRETYFDLVTIENTEDWDRVSEMVGNSDFWGAWIGLYVDVNTWRWSLDNTSFYKEEFGGWFNFVVNMEGSYQHCVELINPELHDNDCNTAESSVCYDETSNSYIPVEVKKTWQDAQSYCRQTYTDLASIRNQQEWDNVMNAITTAGRHWIGLSRESWKWSDQSNSSFRQWGSGQPHGGNEACGGARLSGIFDGFCHSEFSFICSVIPRRIKVVKVTLKTDGSVNLNDPLVQEAILKQMEKDLRGQGVHQEFRLSWRKQPHGDVFNKTQL